MITFQVLYLIAFLLVGNGYAQSDTTGYAAMLEEYYDHSVPLIKPVELNRRLALGEEIHLLDAREGREYKVSCIEGAIHIGFLFYNKGRVEELNKEIPVVVYCTIGARSETIGEKLQKGGFTNVYNLYGGIIHWKNSGYPVYQNGKPTESIHVYSKKWGKWLIKGKAKH